MNIYNLLSRFKKAADVKSFSASEAALYLYLLSQANSQYWQMPFPCPTSAICYSIQKSKQSIWKAREVLRERGFISYTKGSGTNDVPMYTIIDSSTDLPSSRLPGKLSPGKTLPGNLPPYNINNLNLNNNLSHSAREEDVLPLDDLEKMFLNDEPWQESVLSLQFAKDKISTGTFKNYLGEFFNYLRASGNNKREVNDTKNYFINWLKKQPINTHHYGKLYTEHSERRRASGVNPAPKEEYYQPF